MTVEIDLWFWRLDQAAAAPPVLSPDETDRAARFVNPLHANRYRAGRTGLRNILAGYAASDPADLVFDYNPQGKPSVAGGPQFNLSHTGDFAALAVAETGRIGVDIEALRPIEPDIAKRFFSACENTSLSDLPATQWQDGFYRCWTRKEALVKAFGAGLSMPLDSFDVTLTPDMPAQLLRLDGVDSAAKDWALVHLDPAPGIVGAIAVQAKGQTVKLNWRSRA